MNGDNSIVYSLHGDGELDEGQNWEAILFAAHKKVDNTSQQLTGTVSRLTDQPAKVMNLGDLPAKFLAFGWEVVHLEEGNDMDAVVAA